ncbi:mitochondrial translation release factor in rescue-like [Montipora capricornis]|uniref:mitochondrial translation release factor in rescue-like n=1 Tax=Montipora capricornis TaxID=246305 RepID=UPI0035F21448
MIPLTFRVWNSFTEVTALGLRADLMGRLLVSAIFRATRVIDFVRFKHEVSLKENEIEENFIKGWGKGGQSVNKTNNCVQLKHKPSGIIVKCHESRSLARNRTLAREILKQKLDFLINGKESELAQATSKKKKRKADYARKRLRREQALVKGAESPNVEDDMTTFH